MDKQFSERVFSAAKWSSITEIIAKLLAPISNMILARVLAPEAFGVVAMISVIVSFADMFTDAGFQKFLIQHSFQDEDELGRYASVAFFTNLGISLLLWGVISIVSEPLAGVMGGKGLGKVIIVACASLPLTSFSSIQIALYRRKFDFHTLFIIRIISLLIPLFVTVPLSFLWRNYWALIVGQICGNAINAFLLTIKSNWKVSRFYSFQVLKDMLSFSAWNLCETFTIWLTYYIDIFIVGSFLTRHDVGIFNTSTTTVDGIMRIVTSAVTPVLFSTLSRLKDNDREFKKVFLNFQRIVSALVIPMGIGMFVFRQLITDILLGRQWGEAVEFIGLWSVMMAFCIVTGYMTSEVYRSKGRPKISFIVQVLHLVFLIPLLYVGAHHGFQAILYAKLIARGQYILLHLLTMQFVFKISIPKMLSSIVPSVICGSFMGSIGYMLSQMNPSMVWQLTCIVICIMVYGVVIMIFPVERGYILQFITKFKRNRRCLENE